MSANGTTPSPHTTPSADEWLATWITIFGMFFILCIFLSPWLFFTDDPFWSGWGGTPQTTVVRYVRTVPVEPVAPPPRRQPPPPPKNMVRGGAPPPSYQEALRGEPGRSGNSKEPPRSAQVLSLVPDLSRLPQLS